MCELTIGEVIDMTQNFLQELNIEEGMILFIQSITILAISYLVRRIVKIIGWI